MQAQFDGDTNKMTPAELLPKFYEKNNLGDDGGLSSPVVRIEVNKRFHFFMPNYDARRKAVLWHDIHHLATGYSAATFIGECEISAWEIASGCGKYWAAFIIDTSGVVLGCLINPRKIIQAYARGRRTSNLYHDTIPAETVMTMSIVDIQQALGLDKVSMESKASVKDLFNLGLFLIFGGLYSLVSIIQIPLLVLYNIWYAVKRKIS
ncbi:MAG: hypothetical protein IPP15_24035 [Saprospiraceae bacterium]|uniref:Uncharacterized protein n=1 Tax=Candidatus Opimibacter skivensis TaxID=2982028 RepID=A0A9D7T0G0_9BACT|nr:hypothetical protein [Candidatus Opimibacter skivensis]